MSRLGRRALLAHAGLLASGALVELLPDAPPEPLPLNAIHAGDQVLSRRLEVFLNWVKEVFSDLKRRPGSSAR